MAKRVAWLTVLCMVGACTPKVAVPLPMVASPKYPDFVAPAVPVTFAQSPAATSETRGWTFLQAGNLKSAEREFAAALKVAPTFYPAETSLGWVELARQNGKAALAHFDKVLGQRPSNPPALVGRGDAQLSLRREDEALTAFQAAFAADPSLVEVSRRIEVLKFRGLQNDLATARAAARAGKTDEAIRAYTTAIMLSPDSPFLYRELAAIERQSGDPDHALQHFRKAVELDGTDAASLVQIAELLEMQGDLDGAVMTYARALAIDPNSDVQAKFDVVKAKADFAKLPAEYRAIPQTMQVTRGEMAALIGVRLAPLLQVNRRAAPELITDLNNQWAATYIVAVSRAGIMEPFANHAFQPRAVVRRVDLAPVVSRLLARVATLKPARAKAWEGARLRFPDLAASHLAYTAASVSIASGAMKAGQNGGFEPTRVVTGAEAIEIVDRIADLADLSPSPVRGQQ